MKLKSVVWTIDLEVMVDVTTLALEEGLWVEPHIKQAVEETVTSVANSICATAPRDVSTEPTTYAQSFSTSVNGVGVSYVFSAEFGIKVPVSVLINMFSLVNDTLTREVDTHMGRVPVPMNFERLFRAMNLDDLFGNTPKESFSLRLDDLLGGGDSSPYDFFKGENFKINRKDNPFR